MKTLLSKLGFVNKKYKWYDLDPAIQMGFIKKLAESFLVIVFSTLYYIYSQSFTESLLIGSLSIIFVGMAIHYLLFFEYDKFFLIIGTCVEIDRPSSTLFKKQVLGKCEMVVLVENGTPAERYVEVPINYGSKFKTGMQIAIYTTESSVVQKNEDYYYINNPLAISIISRKGIFTEKEKSN